MVNLSKNLILPRRIIKEKGVVVLTLAEYEKIRRKMEELKKQKEISIEEAETLKIIAEGEQEYREGKLKPIKSLAKID